MKSSLLIISLLLSFGQVIAQVKMISFEEYRMTQWSDQQITTQQKQALYPLYFDSPLIDEAEFRTQTNEFDLDQMQYTLRLSTNNREMRKYQNRIYNDLKEEYLFELRRSQEDELEDIYKSYLDYYFDAQKLNLRKQIIPILEDIITTLSKEDRNGELSVVDLINASKRKDKLQIRIDRDESKLYGQLNFEGSEEQAIASVDELGKFMAMFTSITGVPEAMEHQFELRKIENQYQLEKAERDRRLDFAQIRYRGNPEDVWQEKVSIGFGFRFPHSSKNSLDMVELQLEKMIEEQKFEQRKEALESEITDRQTALLEQFDNYYAAEKIVENLKKYDEIIQSISPESKRDIVEILQLNIDSIEEEINLIEAKEELYDSYIELAKSMGFMQDRMNALKINLLSPDLLNQM